MFYVQKWLQEELEDQGIVMYGITWIKMCYQKYYLIPIPKVSTFGKITITKTHIS